MFVINNLKKQVTSLKLIVRAKDEEILGMKQNVKYTKFALLESEYQKKVEEWGIVKQHNEFLQTNLQE